MSVVVHITSEEQEKKYFELFYKLYPKAIKPHSTRSYWYKYDKDVGFNMNNGNSFSVAGWPYYQRNAKQYNYELIEFDEFLKRFDPKPQPKFKVGDRCKIIGKKGHFYPIGTFVVIKKPKSESGNYGVQEDRGTLYQLVHESQLEPCLAAQDEIVEITELNAEQYYGRVGMIVKYHRMCAYKDDVFAEGVKIMKKLPSGNLLCLDLFNNKDFILYIDKSAGVTIKFTDNKQSNQQTMKSKEEIYEAMQAEWLRITGLKVGDYVKVTRKAEDHEGGWGDSWNHQYMLTGETLKIDRILGRAGIRLDGYNYPYFSLESAEAPEKKYELEDGTRDVLIKENGNIECGCLKLTKDNAVKALKIMKDLHQIFSGYIVAIEIQGSSIDSDDLTALTKLIK